MQYTVICSCGNETLVTAAAAGGTITCPKCGGEISVPRLSQLREMAGKGAYETGTADTIRRQIEIGELPPGTLCVISGRPTTAIADIQVQCERTWIRGPTSKRFALVIVGILLLPFWVIWALVTWALLDEEHQELGRDTFVKTPLRIHEECLPQLKRASQRKLRKLLRTVPLYAELLKEYPGAKVIIAK